MELDGVEALVGGCRNYLTHRNPPCPPIAPVSRDAETGSCSVVTLQGLAGAGQAAEYSFTTSGWGQVSSYPPPHRWSGESLYGLIYPGRPGAGYEVLLPAGPVVSV